MTIFHFNRIASFATVIAFNRTAVASTAGSTAGRARAAVAQTAEARAAVAQTAVARAAVAQTAVARAAVARAAVDQTAGRRARCLGQRGLICRQLKQIFPMNLPQSI